MSCVLTVLQSGSIVDGLSFFLKNVTSHFEGIAECAICYSYVQRPSVCLQIGRALRTIFFPRIVNASDGSLPRKPCKTCKNRFHAACLYKVRSPFI